MKKYIKNLQRALARYGMFGTMFLFKFLPYQVLDFISSILINIGFVFVVRQKRIAADSLKIAFVDEKTDSEIKSVVRECFFNLGHSMMELIYCMNHPDYVLKKVEFEGINHIKDALKKGKGVVAVTAHFGNFPLMMYAFAQKGYKVSSIVRPARDEKMEEFLSQRRTLAGLKSIYALPRRKCVDESIKALRNNEIVFIPLDQNFGSGGGVYVDFFGQQAATATGPVVFAKRTDAVIIPIFIVRKNKDKHRIIIERPLDLEDKDTDDKTVAHNIARITNLIESYIRKFPHEWGWMHRRWKSKPNN